MKCLNCNYVNKAGAKFCESCGTKLELALQEVSCDSCNKPNPSNFKFCKHCGAAKSSIKTPSPAVEISRQSTPSLDSREAPTTKPNKKESKGASLIFIVIGVTIIAVVTFFFIGKSGNTGEPLDIAKVQIPNRGTSTNSQSAEVTPSALRTQAQPYIQAMIASIQANNQVALEENVRMISSLSKPAGGDRKSARKLNDVGLAFLKANNFDAAIASFKDAVIADPTDQEVVNNLGYAYYLNDDLERAKSLIEYTLALAPQRTSAWTNYAVILFKQGSSQPAINAYLVAYSFAKNQDRLMAFVEKQAQEDVDVQLRPFYSQVLVEINRRK